VPILLYNIPEFTSKIESVTVKRLLDSGLYAGIKDSSGDWSYFEELLSLRKDRPFTLFAGHDRIAQRALSAGADGVISGCASAIPELVVAIGKSPALNRHLEEFVTWVERFPAPVVIKRAVQLRGQKSGEFAVPFDGKRSAELDEFSKWFTAWWPAVAASIQV
jgi:dihydrodipicolinate synthase/N-acetylneuraminate lyase